MAAGGGLPSFPPGHPLAHPNGSQHLAPSSMAGLTGPGGARPTSTPTTPTNAFAGRSKIIEWSQDFDMSFGVLIRIRWQCEKQIRC